MAGLDDFLSYLVGGTQMGNWLGVTSPTAATQAPLAVAPGTAPTTPAGPLLGGLPPPRQGLLSGLLGGQAPVNPMSYFQPQHGLLGDSPLGNAFRGGFAGLGSGAGYGGLTGMGMAAQGGQQAIQDRRKQEMAGVLGGQEYQKGQQGLISGALANEWALQKVNIARRFYGLPDATMADITTNPDLITNPTGGQPPAPGSSAATGQAAPAASAAPAAPTQGSSQGTIAGPPPQTAVAAQFPNQHGIIVPQAAPPTTTLSRASNVQPQASGQATTAPATTAPATAASAPTAQAATTIPVQGGVDIPDTAEGIANSSLPEWAKQNLYQAYSTGDPATINTARMDIVKYLGAPGQKAAETTATGMATEQLPATVRDSATKLSDNWEKEKAVIAKQEAQPQYRAGLAAYKVRMATKGSTPADIDLINSALHLMNPQQAPFRPSSAQSVTDVSSLGDVWQKAVQEVTSGSGLQLETATAIRDIMDRHWAQISKDYGTTLGNYRNRADFTFKGVPGGVKESVWRSDAPPQITGDTDPAFKALQSGDEYVGPDGVLRTKP